jgi:hypothetical protein
MKATEAMKRFRVAQVAVSADRWSAPISAIYATLEFVGDAD